jgi:magnesium chelatase subunit D
MTAAAPVSPWAQASLAAALFAIDFEGGGVALRAGAGPVRDAWLALLARLLPEERRIRRVPLGIGDDRLLGGLDLSATLRAGRPVVAAGLLAQADGAVLALAMAERLEPATAARIAGAMDRGEVALERDGVALCASTRFGVVALDEGREADERPPASLLDRLAFPLDLGALGYRAAEAVLFDRAEIAAARRRLPAVAVDDDAAAAMVTVAAQLGVDSLRAPILALRAARAHAALRGVARVEEEDVVAAARLVLAPRATRLPAEAPPPESDDPGEAELPPPERDDAPPPEGAADPGASSEEAPPAELMEVVLAAVAAALPGGLLAQIAAGAAGARPGRGGRAGGKAISARRGRPLAARSGDLRHGRLGLVETLRAAAPWQALRRRGRERPDGRRLIVHPEDFRIVRFREPTQTTAIFVVDASGSAAAQRLAEVKGAIELLLADCYVRRDSVALVAFRGAGAQIVLPPTRSLTRAKRMLGGLPGGGGTPLAAGLDVALGLADSVRRKGQKPLIVLMTDGRANVARGGAGGRARAFEDALAAARAVRAAGIAAIAVDAAAATRASGDAPTLLLGNAMNARYIRLPHADAARVSQAVRAASQF